MSDSVVEAWGESSWRPSRALVLRGLASFQNHYVRVSHSYYQTLDKTGLDFTNFATMIQCT
jgi:hypothetical protein